MNEVPRSRRSAVVAALVVVLCVAGAGCSSGSPDSPADKAFLGAVHVEAPQIGSYRSDVALARLGHAACDAFRSGASYQELADRMMLLQGKNPLPSEDLGVVISSAVDSYCPQYRSRVS